MTTTILHISDCERPTAKDVCIFLADYGAGLLASGATCIRLDKNITRIAKSYGMDAEMTVMPRHIHLTIIDECTAEIQTSIATVPDSGISFNVNTELSRLSWAISDDKITFSQAVERYKAIPNNDSMSRWTVLILVTLANASFCRIFGGDSIAILFVAIATFVGFYIKTELLARKVDTRLVFILCSFISSIIGGSDTIFALGTTPEIALSTSVLYLVPGIPFLNSFSDMLYRRYLCAFARFADAMILTFCLTIGLCIAMSLIHANMF
ncbi:MAG: threonine/serine exporter family protein [Prevotella sp.]|nr:threonine/serine exporter family protein [Bacteroides sp.]MCM1366840.1 threonine/serine exporter family protein [Prevotella sp.]MCM1437190.1 threonine/serine exporter family protein [Prevotella sp.]